VAEFWTSSLQETVWASRRIADDLERFRNLKDWLGQYRDQGLTSTNQGTENVAFQRWFRFKEAFSPKFVADTLGSLPYPVKTCLDAFGGSGTTAVTCRMLGKESISIEVNPYLADLIKAKLTPVSPSGFTASYERLISNLRIRKGDTVLGPAMPSTFTEPGVGGRYIFSAEVYQTARAIIRSAATINPTHRRLLRVLLGSVLVGNSNVVINGKGRRYRSSWTERSRPKS
jgi:DNA methylase